MINILSKHWKPIRHSIGVIQIPRLNFSQQYKAEDLTNRAMTKKHISEFFSNFIKKEEQDKLTYCLKSIYKFKAFGYRTGLYENKEEFKQLFETINRQLGKEMVKLNTKLPVKQIEETLRVIKNTYKTIFELQLGTQNVTQVLYQWLQQPKSLNLFIYIRNPLLMLKYFNLLHQNGINVQCFESNIENLIKVFGQNELSLFDRVHYYNAILILRQFTKEEKKSLKQSLLQVIKKNTSYWEGPKFLEVTSEYINLVSWAFYQQSIESNLPILSGSEMEGEESKRDEEIEQALLTCFEMLLDQDDNVYSKEIIENREREDLPVIFVGEVDPTTWRILSNQATGLQVLAAQELINNNHLYRFENCVMRKVETDLADLRYGTNICLLLTKFTEGNKQALHYLLLSLSDQIINHPFEEILWTNESLTKILYCFVKMQEVHGYRTKEVVRPAIGQIFIYINEGKFDDQMRKVDWFDLQQLVEGYNLTQIQKHVQEQIEK